MRSISASTARAAAVASGWPPKVVAWSPGSKARGDIGPRPAGADRHAVAERLGHRHDVGPHAEVLEAEPPAGAAEAGLHLVDHEQQAALVAQRADGLEVLASSPG